jgi:hypothetical protein
MSYRQLMDGFAQLTLGRSTADSIIARDGGVGLRRYCKLSLRSRRLRRECRANKGTLEDLHEIYRKHQAPVTAPLALISQIQRSGGSLLSQLFDGHPELHAHPYELKTGYPKKHLWPRIDLDDSPEHWFEVLFEENVIKDFREGYKKGPNYDTTFPFIFLPSLQRQIFLQAIASRGAASLRDVFNADRIHGHGRDVPRHLAARHGAARCAAVRQSGHRAGRLRGGGDQPRARFA